MKGKALFLAAFVAVFAAGCGGGGGGSKPSAAQQSLSANNALQRHVYQSKHEIEFRNYNWRQQISDDPATIVWCTFFPYDHPPITVPIAGKLTSSNKRPYDSTRYIDAGNYAWYAKEVPGPDHMYGSSSEYRYGFGPLGKADYQDFNGLGSYCTTLPKVWQAQTQIITKTDSTLHSLSIAATAALKAGNAAKAQQYLDKANGGAK